MPDNERKIPKALALDLGCTLEPPGQIKNKQTNKHTCMAAVPILDIYPEQTNFKNTYGRKDRDGRGVRYGAYFLPKTHKKYKNLHVE